MFSEELKILDRNTVKYMIDELQEELDDTKKQLLDKDATIADKNATIAELNTQKTAFMQLINQLDEPDADKEAILSKLRELKK